MGQEKDMAIFGEKLKEYRKNKGLTQEELAGIIGVQNSAISKYETGRIKQIPLHILARLEAIFGFGITEIPISQLKKIPSNTQTTPYLPKEYKKRLSLTESYLHLLFSSPNSEGYFNHFCIDGESFFIVSKDTFEKKDIEQIKTFVQFLINQKDSNNPPPF